MDSIRTPSLFEHSCLAIDYFIQPNDRQIVILGMLKASEYLLLLSWEIVDLERCPSLLNMDLLPPHSILQVKISQGCLRYDFVREFQAEHRDSFFHWMTSPIEQDFFTQQII